MPSFETPQPIAVRLELGVGDVRVAASERADTVVEVRPSDEGNRDDVLAAEQTRVEYADGRLLVKVPKTWRRWSPRSNGGSVDISVALPAGSKLNGEAAIAALRADGRLGDVRYSAGAGHIEVADAGALRLRTGAGDVAVGRALGHTDVSTGSGAVRIERVGGTAVVKNSNGESWIGEVAGSVRVSSANGTIAIERALDTVAAKTANGEIRLGEVVRGAVVAESGYGAVEVGIADGTAAWLDLQSAFGTVRNELDAGAAPAAGEDAVEVRARTGFGDVTVRRAP
ncbi:MAG TPA: DUF4097 family beta strand repeat-containing protein [Solirubrobacter sp.]|nr:DUF4097 family beta strand repeat-containing protein [Solirubrobacter sp.]